MNFIKKLFQEPLYHSVNERLYRAITFDDILLAPGYSTIFSRKKVDLRPDCSKFKLDVPIVSANMDTVTGLDMAKAMSELEALAILHRYQSEADTLDMIRALARINNNYIIPSIGIQPEDYYTALKYLDAGADAICIDIAHGDYNHMEFMIESLRSDHPKLNIIAGNVATYEGTKRLIKAGVDIIKVGIGPGSMCTTRVVTGHGVPQITAISEANRARNELDTGAWIIADGGIRNSGDIVKALAFGADLVMLGSKLAGCDEAPGKIHDNKFKEYRGMASREARASVNPDVKDYTPEGVATTIPRTGSVKSVINHLAGGVRSGFSYSGAYNIKELREKAVFSYISAAAHVEGTPHGL